MPHRPEYHRQASRHWQIRAAARQLIVHIDQWNKRAQAMPGWAFVAAAGTSTEGLLRGLAGDLEPIRIVPGAI